MKKWLKLMTGILTVSMTLNGVSPVLAAESVNTASNTAAVSMSETRDSALPYAFQWGSSTAMGHDEISCSGISVRENQVYADIRFARKKHVSGRAKFSSVKSLGQTVNGSNEFSIPVKVNANTDIEALTSAMSQDHWIHYTIYVGTDEETTKELASAGVQNVTDKAGSIVSTVEKNTDQLDQEAPEIVGLTAEGETEIRYSDLVKIFDYDNGIHLIEVNMAEGTARKGADVAELEKAAEEQPASENVTAQSEPAVRAESGEEPESSSSSAEASSDETEENRSGNPIVRFFKGIADFFRGLFGGTKTEAAVSESSSEDESSVAAIENSYRSEDLGKAYKNEIIKYLVVPADVEIPVGLDKEVVVIQQPADKAYVASDDLLKILDALGADGSVGSVGIKAEDVSVKAISSRMAEDYQGDDKVDFGGAYDDWSLRSMIKDKTNLAIEPSDILPKDAKTLTEDFAAFERLASRASQMGFAMFTDRSGDEASDLAKAEWYKVYGVIFGCEDKAEKLYQQAVAEAGKN